MKQITLTKTKINIINYAFNGSPAENEDRINTVITFYEDRQIICLRPL